MRKKNQNEFGAVYLILALLLGFFLGSTVVYWNFNRQHEKLFTQTYEKLLAVFSDNSTAQAPAPTLQQPIIQNNTSTAPAGRAPEGMDTAEEMTTEEEASLSSDTTEVYFVDIAEDFTIDEPADFWEEDDAKITAPNSILTAPGYTLARDRLLHSSSITVPVTAKRYSLADKRLDSLLGNRSQPQQQHYFYLEFWESPLNSLGYKMGKNKIVFYGIRQYDMVGISNHKGNFYLSYLNELYLLEFTNAFKPLVPLGESLPAEEMIQEL